MSYIQLLTPGPFETRETLKKRLRDNYFDKDLTYGDLFMLVYLWTKLEPNEQRFDEHPADREKVASILRKEFARITETEEDSYKFMMGLREEPYFSPLFSARDMMNLDITVI